MKKVALVLLILLMVIFNSINPVLADGVDTSSFVTYEEIENEDTPAKPKKESTNNVFIYLTGFGVLTIGAILLKQSQHKQDITLNVDSVEANGDGSYIISFGYNNPNSAITFEDGDYGIRVLKGNAILLKKPYTNQFTNGLHKNETVVVINEDSVVEYFVGKKKICIKGREILKKEEAKHD